MSYPTQALIHEVARTWKEGGGDAKGFWSFWPSILAELQKLEQTPLENHIGSLGVTLQPDEAENWTCPRCQHQTSTMLTRCYVCGTPRGVVQP